MTSRAEITMLEPPQSAASKGRTMASLQVNRVRTKKNQPRRRLGTSAAGGVMWNS